MRVLRAVARAVQSLLISEVRQPVRMLLMARSGPRTKPPQTHSVQSDDPGPNPVWFKPIMFGFMLVGLAWIIVFYASQSTLPIPSLGAWNIMVGFGIAFVGFLMTTRWR